MALGTAVGVTVMPAGTTAAGSGIFFFNAGFFTGVGESLLESDDDESSDDEDRAVFLATPFLAAVAGATAR
jgi:hypothetical protein